MASVTEIRTSEAPGPFLVFSQATKANGFVFCSGNIGFHKDTMKLVEGGIRAQTEQALKNLAAVLKAAGSGFDRALKINIYIKTFEHYAPMNEVYMEFFPGSKPARTCVAVQDLPFGADVEIECTALVE